MKAFTLKLGESFLGFLCHLGFLSILRHLFFPQFYFMEKYVVFYGQWCLTITINQMTIVSVSCSVISFFGTSRTVARQAPLSMEFSRQESWDGLPFLSPEDPSLPRDRTRVSYVSCVVGGFFTSWATREA